MTPREGASGGELVRKEGWSFCFDPTACERCAGRCCTGDPGHVFVNAREVRAIARHLSMSVDRFIVTHLRRVGRRYSLKERKMAPDDFHCAFFDAGKGGCTIYKVRPQQCRDFPFWEPFKEDSAEVAVECPGVQLDPTEP